MAWTTVYLSALFSSEFKSNHCDVKINYGKRPVHWEGLDGGVRRLHIQISLTFEKSLSRWITICITSSYRPRKTDKTVPYGTDLWDVCLFTLCQRNPCHKPHLWQLTGQLKHTDVHCIPSWKEKKRIHFTVTHKDLLLDKLWLVIPVANVRYLIQSQIRNLVVHLNILYFFQANWKCHRINYYFCQTLFSFELECRGHLHSRSRRPIWKVV